MYSYVGRKFIIKKIKYNIKSETLWYLPRQHKVRNRIVPEQHKLVGQRLTNSWPTLDNGWPTNLCCSGIVTGHSEKFFTRLYI